MTRACSTSSIALGKRPPISGPYVLIYRVVVCHEQRCYLCVATQWVPDPRYAATENLASARAVILWTSPNHERVVICIQAVLL